MQGFTGDKSQADGVGIVIIHLPTSEITIPLWPCYYMPDNPQNTISPGAIKIYNKFRNVTTEHLQYVKFTDDTGSKVKLFTITDISNDTYLDYIEVDLIKIHNESTLSSTHSPSTKTTPIINATSFTTHIALDPTLIHRRLMHLNHRTISTMCKEGTMTNLPKRINNTSNNCPCTICWLAKAHAPA